MCSNLVENLHDLLIDDLTPENCISTVHVNDSSVAEGRQSGVSQFLHGALQTVYKKELKPILTP
jgi:hypothetical protein